VTANTLPATTQKIIGFVNGGNFPGAIVPKSLVDKAVIGDFGNISGISTVDTKQVYKGDDTDDQIDNWKLNYALNDYRSQQGAMVVDHFVHYDGFMVVEMGEVKTRW
jgi:hypothetical protein